MSDEDQRGIWGDPPNRFEPPEHQAPGEVDDAATRRVEEFNEAQRRNAAEEARWRAIHREHLEQLERSEAEGRRAAEGAEPRTWKPPRQGSGSDASHRRSIPQGGREVGGENRPPRTEQRGWDNRRDDPNREEEFYPPEQMLRHQPPRRGTPAAPIDLGPAAGRRVGDQGPERPMGSKPLLPSSPPDPIGQVEKQIRRQEPKSRKPAAKPQQQSGGTGDMASVSETYGAIQQTKGTMETELGAALYAVRERAADALNAVLMLDGGTNVPTLLNARLCLNGIAEKAGESLGLLQEAMNLLDAYAATVATS